MTRRVAAGLLTGLVWLMFFAPWLSAENAVHSVDRFGRMLDKTSGVGLYGATSDFVGNMAKTVTGQNVSGVLTGYQIVRSGKSAMAELFGGMAVMFGSKKSDPRNVKYAVVIPALFSGFAFLWALLGKYRRFMAFAGVLILLFGLLASAYCTGILGPGLPAGMRVEYGLWTINACYIGLGSYLILRFMASKKRK